MELDSSICYVQKLKELVLSDKDDHSTRAFPAARQVTPAQNGNLGHVESLGTARTSKACATRINLVIRKTRIITVPLNIVKH